MRSVLSTIEFYHFFNCITIKEVWDTLTAIHENPTMIEKGKHMYPRK